MPDVLEHSHTGQAIHDRLASGPRRSYLRDWIYGGIDGTVTTFAIVAGVVGADLSASILLILGFANLVADGFAMAAGNFIGTKSEREDYERVLAIERRHIAVVPDGEREEIRQIFEAKGFSGDDLDRVVAVITADRALWAKTMAVEEYGLSPTLRSPVLAALEHICRLHFVRLRAAGDLPVAGRAHVLRRRDRRDFFRRRCDQEPLVAIGVVAIGSGSAPDRDVRRRTGIRRGLWVSDAVQFVGHLIAAPTVFSDEITRRHPIVTKGSMPAAAKLKGSA